MRKSASVAAIHDRFAEVFLECRMMSEESRHEEIKYRPQFLNTILKGRPCECQPIFGRDRLYRMRVLGARILDPLRFVEQQIVKRFLACFVPFDIALRERIRRY